MLSSRRYRKVNAVSSSSMITNERAASRPTTSMAVDRRDVEPRFEDELDRGQGSAPGERRQRPQAALVVGEQQVVAPPDRRLQRASSGGLRARGVLQHGEPVVEPAGDLVDRQGLGTRRGELDRERETVECETELMDQARVARRAVGSLCAGATGEQIDGVGEVQGRELVADRAVDVEGHLGRAEDPDPGRGVEHAGRDRRRSLPPRARSCRGRGRHVRFGVVRTAPHRHR